MNWLSPVLHALCREKNIVLIADEVMAGFGRTGKWFGWQHAGDEFRPDMMTLAKGLTGAHIPLGAVVVSELINKQLQSQMLYTGLTYCGHPLACAAGLAALEAYEDEGLIDRSRHLGHELFQMLKHLQKRHAVIGDVRGDGMFAVLELVKDRETREPVTTWGASDPTLRELVSRARGRGVSFAVRSNLIVIAPPLVITEVELAQAFSVLDELLTEFSPILTGVVA